MIFLDFFSRTVTSCKKKESLKNSLPHSRYYIVQSIANSVSKLHAKS